MNQSVSSLLYLGVGIIALALVSHLLLQLMTLIFGLYCIFMGLSAQSQPPTAAIFIRRMFGRFFSRF